MNNSNNVFEKLRDKEKTLREIGSKFIARIYKWPYVFLQATDWVYLIGQKVPNIDELATVKKEGNLTLLTWKNGYSVWFIDELLEENWFIDNFDFSQAIPIRKIWDFEARKEDVIYIDSKRDLFWNWNLISGFDINQAVPLKWKGTNHKNNTSYLTDGNIVLFWWEKVWLNSENSYTVLDENTLITDTQVIVQWKILEWVSPKWVEEIKAGHYINDDGMIFYTWTNGGVWWLIPGRFSKDSLAFWTINIGWEKNTGFMLVWKMKQWKNPSYNPDWWQEDSYKIKGVLEWGSMIYQWKILNGPRNWLLTRESLNWYPEYMTERYWTSMGDRMMDNYRNEVMPKSKKLSTYGWEGIPNEWRIHEQEIWWWDTSFHSHDSQNNIYCSGDKIIDFSRLIQIRGTNKELFDTIIDSFKYYKEVQDFLDKKFKIYDIGYNLGKRVAWIMK